MKSSEHIIILPCKLKFIMKILIKVADEVIVQVILRERNFTQSIHALFITITYTIFYTILHILYTEHYNN